MLATLLAIIIGVAIALHPADISIFMPLMVTLPSLLLLLPAIIWALGFMPLEKAEYKLTPRLLELVKSDRWLKVVNAGLVIFPLLALFSCLDPAVFQAISPKAATIVWLISIGISVDLIYILVKKILDYLNPFSVVNAFSKAARQSVDNDRELDLCNWTEALSEVGIKSLNYSCNSLCHHSVNEMRENLRLFLECSKSLGHPAQDPQSTSEGITDKVSYTIFFFLDRFAQIFNKALSDNMEPTCSAIVTTLGKVTVDAANCDLTLVSYPVQMLGDCCRKAEAKGLPIVSVKGGCTLVEATKAILNQNDLTYQDLKDPMIGIINQLDAIAKETFRLNKQSNIGLLIQPLKDLKLEFQKDKMASHRDTPSIIATIDSVLAEWSTLETVLRTMPPIPSISDIESSTSESPNTF